MATYHINNLGTFNQYTPASGDTSKQYFKRSTDNVDLYTFVQDPANFTPGSVKILAMAYTSYDYSAQKSVLQYYTPYAGIKFDISDLVIFGAGSSPLTLLEVTDYTGFEPYSEFSLTQIKPDLTTVIRPYGSPTPGTHKLGLAFKRATDAEAATIETILAGLPPRDQRVAELLDLTLTDAVFQELVTAFVSAFGLPRAQVLLAQV